jgi:hypothetical protein
MIRCTVLYAIIGFAFWKESQAFSPISARTSSTRGARQTTHDGIWMLSASPMELDLNNEVGDPSTGRRSLLALLALLPVTPALADDITTQSPSSFLQVTVTLSKSAAAEISTPAQTSALYITARPNSADNVPRAILDGSRGKPPPVLIARIPNVCQFPFTTTLTSKDVTVEGSSNEGANSSYWWRGTPLVVSARLDSDGVAATRDPSDLVGRSISSTGNSAVTVELQGRGAAGKFFTKKEQPASS